jgi:hypothetical protein
VAKFIKDDEAYFAAQRLVLKLIKELPHVEIDIKEHNVNYLPEETVYFIDKEYMDRFDRIKNIAVRDCKVINYGKPAVNVIFNSKHKYFVKKKIAKTTIKPMMLTQINQLEAAMEKLEVELTDETGKTKAAKKRKEIEDKFKIRRKEIENRITLCKAVFVKTDEYDFAVSNYYKYYTYTFVSFKYLDTGSGMLVSENSHIVKNMVREGRLLKKKSNIIFVDAEAMKNHCPYQNKKVESFLEKFEYRFDYGVQDLFIKKLPVEEETAETRYLENWPEFERQFLRFLSDYKESHRLRSGLIRDGKRVRDELKNNPGYKAAFKKVCEKLLGKVSAEFKTLYGQGYFYIGEKEIMAIAGEQNREYLMLLLFQVLLHSHKENPLEEARKTILEKKNK